MFHRKNRLLLIEVLTLVAAGLIMIASSSVYWAEFKYHNPWYFVQRQALFAGLGLVAMNLTSRLNIQKLREKQKPILIGCYIALALVLIPGLGVQRNGSRSWFGVGSFLIQPSEFFKLALILSVSDYLASKDRIKSLRRDLLVPLFLTMLGFGLILLQPDFGSGLVMVCSIVVIVLAADAPFKYFIRLGLLGAAGLTGLILAAPYRMARIVSFLDPWQDPLGSGFQIIQSLFAIAPGGLLGAGLNRSMQKHFYLPEPQTDFIFAITAEELGWIGASLIIIIYLLIILEGVRIAKNAHDPFLCYVAVGIVSLFAIQVMINLGVVVGLFPVTGITLPLMSYGGSSLVMIMASLGILMSSAKA